MLHSVSVTIAASPELIWNVLADVEQYPQWTAAAAVTTWLDAGPVVIGSKIRVKPRGLPATVWHVSELDYPRSLTLRHRTLLNGLTSETIHTLTASADGGTNVMLSIRQTGWMAGLVRLLQRQSLTRQMREEAERLKKRCEHHP